MSDLLNLSGVTKTFGGLVAVNDVSFSVEQGSVMGIIGPNGAGKNLGVQPDYRQLYAGSG